MCRAQSEGGRRCPGGGRAAGHAGDNGERESYYGTRWQGYDEAAQRGEEVNRRVYEGETVEDIMSDRIRKAAEARIAQIAGEGW